MTSLLLLGTSVTAYATDADAGRRRLCGNRGHPPLAAVALLGLLILGVTAAGSKSGTGITDEGALSLLLLL